MKKAYLFVYDDQVGTRDQIKDYLDSMDAVITWRYDMPHAFYVISKARAEDLARELRNRTGEKGRFVFTEFAGNEQGWLTKETWYLINNKEHKQETSS